MKRRLTLILAVVVGLCAFTGCAPKEGYRYTVADTFDTVIEIICYTSEADAEKYGKQAEQILKYWHKLSDGFTDWAQVSGVYELNRANGQWVQAEPDLLSLLNFGIEAYEKTDGVVNMMGGAVTLLWKDTDTPPSEQALRQAGQHTDIGLLEIKGDQVRLTDPEARLDVGAFAKGYALQQAATALKKDGFCGILSAVSSVVTVGDKNGEPFAVGIGDQQGGVAQILQLCDVSLSTSGTDQRYFTFEGKNYHHIIDLSDGKPADSGITQASVVHSDAAWADVYSTAALISGDTEQSAILRCEDGTLRYTGDIKKWK